MPTYDAARTLKGKVAGGVMAADNYAESCLFRSSLT
jgi:hypothetical protein